MGVTSANQIVFKIDEDTDAAQLALVARARKEKSGQDRAPKIAIDASVLAHKWGALKQRMEDKIVKLAVLLASYGLDVVTICDNSEDRHPSKRASCQRRAQQDLHRLNAVKYRLEIMQLTSLLKTPPAGCYKRVEKKGC